MCATGRGTEAIRAALAFAAVFSTPAMGISYVGNRAASPASIPASSDSLRMNGGSALSVDYLVMGAGVAGLRAAIELAEQGEVLVVTKESLGESNTHYAQGGIAVAMEGDADIALHLEDTIAAGDGLVYTPAAKVLVAEGPIRVAELIEWGANFDREGDGDAGQLLRTPRGVPPFSTAHPARQRRRHGCRD